MAKKYDVCYGENYTAGGEEKVRWKNVGAVIETKNGFALLLDRTFNPAGCKDDGRSSVMLNLFSPRPKDQTRQSGNHSQADIDDDIPF